MCKRMAVLLGTALGAAALATGASAADPVHLSGDFSFPDVVCGISVVHEVQFIDNFGAKADGSTYDSGYLIETLTAADGRAVKIKYDAGHVENAPPAIGPDGSFTFVSTYSGLNAKTQAVGGPVLEQGSGRVQATAVFDADGNLVSFTAVSLSGQNPNLTGQPDCSVVGPYLAGA